MLQSRNISDGLAKTVDTALSDDGETLCPCLLTQNGGNILHHRFNIEFGLFQAEFPSLDFRKLKHTVDDFQQVLPGFFYFYKAIILLWTDPGATQQVRHSHNCIQWSSNFMRHIGQKNTLGHIGRFGILLGIGKLQFRTPAPNNSPQVVTNQLQFSYI